MTREELKHITDLCFTVPEAIRRFGEERTYYAEEIAAAKKIVMDMLEQEPCEDAISRQAVDNLSRDLVQITRDKADFLCNFWEGLQKLPPVTPQPKTGHWIDREIYDADRWECSECGRTLLWREKYCPNCGCRMESEAKE